MGVFIYIEIVLFIY